MYTIKFQPHDQDNLDFIPFKWGKDEIPSFLDRDKVLQFSIKNGHIKNTEQIQTLVSGSNHVEPYFTSLSAAEACAFSLEDADAELIFSAMQYEYEVF